MGKCINGKCAKGCQLLMKKTIFLSVLSGRDASGVERMSVQWENLRGSAFIVEAEPRTRENVSKFSKISLRNSFVPFMLNGSISCFTFVAYNSRFSLLTSECGHPVVLRLFMA